jgi:uncharacterized protein (TIGR03437 family)
VRLIRRTIIGLALSLGAGVLAYAAPPANCGQLNAGFQVLSNVSAGLSGGSSYSGALKMAVWYPTSTPGATFSYFGPGGDITGQVALNAPIASCSPQFPLVVFSHGWSGCGTQSVFLTEQLARMGYIIAAPDHEDRGCSVDGSPENLQEVNFVFPLKMFGDPSVWTDRTATYRNVDIETVLNYMLNTWTYKSSINPNAIAMSGHSFGGYTTFAKIGGWDSWLDTRFKAAILYSPYVQAFQYQTPSRIPAPTVPQLYMTGGQADIGIMPFVKGPLPKTGQPGAIQQAQFPKYYGELPGTGIPASHLAFSNTLCTKALNAGSPTSVQSCLNNVTQAQLIVNYSQDFLDRYLMGQTPSKLFSAGAGWNTYWRTGGVPAGSYLPGLPAARSGLASIKGENLASGTVAPPGSASMPLSLNGVTVTITDEAGISRPAPLYAIASTQYNFVIPDAIPAGTYTVVAKDSTGAVIAAGPISVQSISPAFFPIYTGPGYGWGWAQQVGASGDTNYLAIYDANAQAPIPVNVTQPSTYLVLAATGVRFATDLQATIGGVPVPVNAGPYAIYQGIDTIALGPLPASLAGKGQVSIVVTAGGMQSNTVAVVIQ